MIADFADEKSIVNEIYDDDGKIKPIFVISNEGFSQRMDRTALGNAPEQQAVIYEDLKKVTTPYDLRVAHGRGKLSERRQRTKRTSPRR